MDNPFTTSAARTLSTNPAYAQVSSVPSWLPQERTGELESEYRNIPQNFSHSEFDTASKNQQSRVLTTSLNAGNAAAADYSNRARQAGGSGLAAGLIKAQAQVGAQSTAGAMELDRQRFDASQREKAATQAGQIAQTLGTLRDSYLKSIVSYATQEDAISVDRGRLALDAAKFNDSKKSDLGSYFVDNMGKVSSMRGDPLSGNPFFNTDNGYLAFGGR